MQLCYATGTSMHLIIFEQLCCSSLMHLINSIRRANRLLRSIALDLNIIRWIFFQQTNCFLTLVRHNIIVVNNQFMVETTFTLIHILSRLLINDGSNC